MILPLDDRLLVCETNTLDIYSYRDTNGNGVADEKKLFHAGGNPPAFAKPLRLEDHSRAWQEPRLRSRRKPENPI